MEVVVTTGAISRAKFQSNRHHQHPTFYRPDALPVAQPTVSKHWREKYHTPWTCLPQAHWGVFQLCLWPWLLVILGRVAMPLSPLMPVPQITGYYWRLLSVNTDLCDWMSFPWPNQHCQTNEGLYVVLPSTEFTACTNDAHERITKYNTIWYDNNNNNNNL